MLTDRLGVPQREDGRVAKVELEGSLPIEAMPDSNFHHCVSMQVEVLKEVDKRPMDDEEVQATKRQKARVMSMTMHACIHEVSRSS